LDTFKPNIYNQKMTIIAIVIASFALLLLILYIANVKFEFRYSRGKEDHNVAPENTAIQKLSYRELEILKTLSEGKSNKEIAEALSVSVFTIKKHVSNIYRKLNISRRVEARQLKKYLE
jgi:DNA-binding NarL/FixJ family response regulator